MAKIIYEVVEHDGGWAYRASGAYSETYRTREQARAAAEQAAARQRLGGMTTGITWEDRDGEWHQEVAKGDDRPDTEVAG